MVLSVWVAEWILDEDRRTLSVGETLSEWLTFTEVERLPHVPPGQLQTIRGVARARPRWPGAEDGRHPVTSGAIRRVRMEWQATGTETNGQRVPPPPGASSHYEDVPVSYLPGFDDGPGSGFPHDSAASSPQALRWSGCLVDLEPDAPVPSASQES